MSLDILRVVDFSEDEMNDIVTLSKSLGVSPNQFIVMAVHERSSDIIKKKTIG